VRSVKQRERPRWRQRWPERFPTQADDRLAAALGDAAADGSSAPARAGVAHAAVVLREVPEVLLDDALASVREVMLDDEARQRPRDRVLRRIEEVPPQLAQLAANPSTGARHSRRRR
jgi:hypothetical protein